MRIISGKYKGRRLNAKVPANVRPTQDAFRETIFNILANHIEFDGLRVCDLCCGTGALGFEALSRGAEFVHFVDISKSSISYVKAVAEELRLEKSEFKTILGKAETFFDKYDGESPIDLVLTDPPYSANIINQIIFNASRSSKFSDGGLIAAEYGSSWTLILPDNMEVLAERSFTIAKFTLLRKKQITSS